MSRSGGAARAIVGVTLVALLGACASGSNQSSSPNGAPVGSNGNAGSAGPSATSSGRRPAGPSAKLDEITAAGAPYVASGTAYPVPPGYVEHEYVASGTATSYSAATPLSNDGRWALQPGATAPYRTRIVVRRPGDAAKSSGTVVVEWLNVSGGVDADPDYVSLAEEITRRGDAWVGVSAQLIGVEGGRVLVTAPGGEGIAGKGLKALDPARYGSLAHPGDGFSFDIYTQVARAVRDGGAPLGGPQPARVIAVGESQSAIALTTYYNGVQPLTDAFDGFLIHSRGSGTLPLVDPGQSADIAGSVTSSRGPFLFRSDLDAPVLDMQTEGDLIGVLNSVAARQPDSDRFRLWEVAGTSHADTHLVGSQASALDCGAAINDGPMHIVAKAGLRALDTWLRTGEPPPPAPRLELADGDAEIRRDQDGIAVGGIRTPPVDVPVVVLSGKPGSNPQVICILMGSTTPLPAARIAELYPSRDAYEQRYRAAADAAITSGYVLPEDRDSLLTFADPSRVAP